MAKNTNWLGDEFKVGDWVYRGARQGNSSEYKVGEVTKVDDKGVQVHWRYAPTYVWSGDYTDAVRIAHGLDNKGRPDVNSLVLLRPTIGLRLAAQVSKLEEFYRLDDSIRR